MILESPPIPPHIAADLQAFESALRSYLDGTLPDEKWRPFRLTHGIYGQRQGGSWQMVRVKLPAGVVTGDQLGVLAEAARRWGRGVAHLTTRQDVQIHWVPLADVPTFLHAIGAAGMTTREACGNAVRNVAAEALAGVRPDEAFDVTPYAEEIAEFLMRHPRTQGLPRKFKIAFSGTADDAGQAAINDIGAIARVVDGVRGFQLRVGGGLGVQPHPSAVLHDFLPAAELAASCEAIIRVFDRTGERKDRKRARLKYVLMRLGLEGFREEYERELREVREGERAKPFPEFDGAVRRAERTPAGVRPPSEAPADLAETEWFRSNVLAQKQTGYYAVTAWVRMGDIDSDRLAGLGEVVRRYSADEARISNEQNVVLRYVAGQDLPALRADLEALGLAAPNANSVFDVTSCPGTTTCALGVTNSKGLGDGLVAHMERARSRFAGVPGLRIKISGCPNSCGQHHVAPIGLYGCSKTVAGRPVPHALLLWGGSLGIDSQLGKIVIKLPAKAVPEAVTRLVELWRSERRDDEPFDAFARRTDRAKVKGLLEDLAAVDPADEDAFRDWGESGAFALADLGPGECAQ
ncbi:MAG: nitrite/sulfite reductase [Candidatus Brocadiae bacterium]|nr:nitrite/sulfite reductase [Candidatus Brocadiia bacterium]